jgi:hypothetical protein
MRMRIYRLSGYDEPEAPGGAGTSREYAVGLDLGPVTQTTGLALLETDDEGRSCHVRQLRRYPPGTGYQQIAASVADLVGRAPIARRPDERRDRRAPQLVVGVTAVGQTVGRGFAPLDVETVRATISAGDAEVCVGDEVRVPKRELIGALQSGLQERRLVVASKLPDAAALVEELQGYTMRIRVSAEGDEWRREGARLDDLVLALGLAYWRLSVARPPEWWCAVARW